MEENFLLLFRFDNPLESSVEFMKVREDTHFFFVVEPLRGGGGSKPPEAKSHKRKKNTKKYMNYLGLGGRGNWTLEVQPLKKYLVFCVCLP